MPQKENCLRTPTSILLFRAAVCEEEDSSQHLHASLYIFPQMSCIVLSWNEFCFCLIIVHYFNFLRGNLYTVQMYFAVGHLSFLSSLDYKTLKHLILLTVTAMSKNLQLPLPITVPFNCNVSHYYFLG